MSPFLHIKYDIISLVSIYKIFHTKPGLFSEQNSPVSGTKLVAVHSNESSVTGVGRGREGARVSDHIKYLLCENA